MNRKMFVTTIPNFSETGINSFCWFLEKGLGHELRNFASLVDAFVKNVRVYSDEFVLRRPQFSPLHCKKHDLTYAVRIYIPIEFVSEGIVNEALMFWGEIPLMTNEGTFIINGFERIIINQTIRNAGVYYKWEGLKNLLYSAILISRRGSWLKFECDPITRKVVIRLNKFESIEVGELLDLCRVNYVQQDCQFEIYDSDSSNNSPVLSPQNLVEPLESRSLISLTQSDFDSISRVRDKSFLRIFNGKLYDIGKLGREKLNKKFSLPIAPYVSNITVDDVVAITNYLVKLHADIGSLDDIDDLKNRRIRSVGELLQNQLSVGLARFERLVCDQFNISERPNVETFVDPKPIIAAVKEFFGSSQLSQFMDQTNPIASLTHKRRISSLGPGGLKRDRLSLAVRDIHPSHYGRICPIETPEGQNAGLLASLASYTRINELGFLETPFFKVEKGKVFNKTAPIYLTSEEEETIPTTLAANLFNKKNLMLNSQKLIPVRYRNEFNLTTINHVNLISVSPIQSLSIATALIPFLEHDDANRALMGSNMQRQALPLIYPSKPIVGTGLEHQVVADSGSVVISKFFGLVRRVSSRFIFIETSKNEIVMYELQKFLRSNQATCINQRPIVWPNENVTSGQVIADGPSTNEGELALGQNLLVAYMPWEGYNYEDAILINERLVQEDLFTSIHIDKFDLDVNMTDFGLETITRYIPNIDGKQVVNLDASGIIRKGSFVTPGDILVGKVTPIKLTKPRPEGLLLRALFGLTADDGYDSSLRVPKGSFGRVIDIRVFRNNKDYILQEGSASLVRVFVATCRKIKVGDKMAGRHGNKGIVSRILPNQDMPFLPNGVSVDILLNPLGVPSRMNVGQIFECLLGLAGSKLNRRFKIRPFDEMYGKEASRSMVNWYLAEASRTVHEPWLFNAFSPGRVELRDGRTGILFDNTVLIGQAYMLKLIHRVDDKMHSRSTGPYSLVTQQPLGGKSRRGGQRFGEMEVWALQAFGCAYTLRELLTIKSDDIDGRNDMLDAIINGRPVPEPSIPESFKVLMHELHSLGLDISLYQLHKTLADSPSEVEVDLVYEYEKELLSAKSLIDQDYF